MQANRKTGFTLLEVIIAVSLLTIGMLGLAAAFSQVIRTHAGVTRRQTALLLASTKFTELSHTSLAQMGELEGIFSPPFEDYAWKATLTLSARDPSMVSIQVSVEHVSRDTASLNGLMVEQ